MLIGHMKAIDCTPRDTHFGRIAFSVYVFLSHIFLKRNQIKKIITTNQSLSHKTEAKVFFEVF